MSVDSAVVQPARKLMLAGKLEEAEKLLRGSPDPWAKIHLADLLILRWPFERERVEEAVALLEDASKTYRDLAQASIARAKALIALAPDPVTDALRDKLGHHAFRPGQRAVIDAILKGRHALAVFPPGHGKSLLYELSAELLEGSTVVVTPDVVAPDPEGRLRRFRDGELKILYIDPERFLTSEIGVRVDLVAVEDAHCASERSHDFRPVYLRLRDGISRVRPMSVLALAPVATPAVRAEIVEKLGLQNPVVPIVSFDRPKVVWELRAGRGLDKAAEIAVLARGGDAAVFGAPGFRVPEGSVRHVVHAQYPLSLEEYFLQASRATAKAVLLFDPADKEATHAEIDRRYPDRATVVRAFETGEAGPALEFLRSMGYVGADGRPTEEAPVVSRLDLTDLDRRRSLAEERLGAIERYIETKGCRRREMLAYFGETPPSGWACGGCDRCRPVTPESKRSPQALDAVLGLVRELESKRLTVNDMARAMLFLGRGLKGLTESDVREILHALIREGQAEVVPQGQWVRVKRG